MKRITFLILLMFLALVVAPSLCFATDDGAVESLEPFVDLDGDGFDDNLDDSNGDGIPDRYSSAQPAPEIAFEGIEDIFVLDNDPGSFITPKPSNCSVYGKLKFTVRGITSWRMGLDAGDSFGPESQGGGTSLHCVGGVCY